MGNPNPFFVRLADSEKGYELSVTFVDEDMPERWGPYTAVRIQNGFLFVSTKENSAMTVALLLPDGRWVPLEPPLPRTYEVNINLYKTIKYITIEPVE